MAELVGDAYIRITADTTVMKRALARDMKDAGKNDAGEYIRSFSNEVKSTSDAKLAGARRSFAKALADPKEFDRLAKNFDSIENAAEHWRKKLVELNAQHKLAKGDMDVFTNAVNKWEVSAKKARKAQIEMTKAHEEALVINRRLTDEWAAHRIETDRNRKATEKLAREEQALADRRAAWYRRENDRRRGIRRNFDGDIIGRASRFGRSLDKMDHMMGRFSDKVAKGFGKGSRNNFINIIGSMAGGITRLVGKVITGVANIGGAFTDAFSAARTAWSNTRNVFSAAGAGIGAFAKGIFKAGPALAAAAAGLFAFSVLIPGVVAGLSLLAGAVLSVVSAISYGLVGALLAATPALLGLVAGFGAVGVAFVSFFGDKKKKQIVADFMKPIKDLGKKFKPQVEEFLGLFKGGLKGAFDDLTPSVNAFFTSWKKNMNDPSTKKGISNFSDSIGRMATTFNTALPHALSGLIGFFQPILPYAEKLATSIGNAFKTFDDWANSKPGQNSIAEFMKTAWAEAHKVWNILVDVKDLIFTLFEISEPTGGGILDGLHSKLREMIGWLQDPANKGKIDEWFANAGTMAVDVGNHAESLGEIIRNFNSKDAQENAKNIMNVINGIGAAAAAVSSTADAIGRAWGWLQKIDDFFALDQREGSVGGWLHDKIFGKDKKPVMPTFKPQQVPTVDPKKVLEGRKAQVETWRTANIKVGVTLGKEQVKAIEDYQFKDKTIPIKGNEDLWAIMRDGAAAYVFTPKQIVVGADTTEWDKAKGTAAGYVFDTKNIKLTADASDVAAAVKSAKAYLSTLPASKRIRIAGVNGVGGITTAAGGVFDGAQNRIIAEAGPEAVVPLDRPLSMVDPAVRQLSAIAQGMTGPKGLPAANAGPRVQFSEGAIQVNLPTGDPKQAAEAVLDRLVSYIG